MNKQSFPAMLLALALPGAGHWYLGKRRRAAVFFSVVLSMFTIGLALEGRLYRFEQGKPLTYLAAPASMANGITYLLARITGRGDGDVQSNTFEYGTAFALTSGLMNLLLVLDVFDLSARRKQ